VAVVPPFSSSYTEELNFLKDHKNNAEYVEGTFSPSSIEGQKENKRKKEWK